MEELLSKINAEVISVLPNKIKISINDLDKFREAEEKLTVGSYLRISDSDDCAIISIIDNFIIDTSTGERKYIIESVPLGFLDTENKFHRGGNNIAIPPIGVKPAKEENIQSIYSQIDMKKQFCFSTLVQNKKIKIPLDGDRFFNKHIAVVGSTGSGKSHAISKILQEVVEQKESRYKGLNNSHIILFDIHGEYNTAFPKANKINVEKLVLPYWLMNSEELEELFIDTEAQDHNQRNIFKEAIILNKKKNNPGFDEKNITYDTPIKFNIKEILMYLTNKNNNRKDKNNIIRWKLEERDAASFEINSSNNHLLFEKKLMPDGSAQGPNFGDFMNFISRLENKINDKRLDFLLADKVLTVDFNNVLEQFLGYVKDAKANITVIDLSGVPFEVLNITVSLISRILFDFGFYMKNKFKDNNTTPILLIYEEAHRYVPKSTLAKYNASKFALERISKEGRKYGVTLVIVSQRPSEISETIFSQCNNFIIMRLTNPEDQNYVKRLLPDSLGPITDTLPVLEAGQALLIGDSVIMPCLVKIDRCSPEPSSNDIDYLQEWKKPWVDVEFEKLIESWKK